MKPNVAVIMCTFNRVHRLQKTVDMLSQQTFKEFHFFIWNNNPAEIATVDKVAEGVGFIKLVKHSPNIGGVGRFILAKDISDAYDKIIFIDDDQEFGADLIQSMYDVSADKTIISWWGWKLGRNYMNRTRCSTISSESDYCGTGGMITDSTIFKTLDLSDLPDKYRFIEDLWLSFVARYDYKYELYGWQFPIWCVDDRQDQWRRITLNLKNEFYQLLKKQYGKCS